MRKPLYCYSLILIIATFSLGLAPGAWAVELQKHFNHASFNEESSYFVTNQPHADIQAALSYKGEWSAPPKGSPNFGHSANSYWLRATVSNHSGIDHNLLLAVKYPLIDTINVYQVESGKVIQQFEMGDSKPFIERPLKNRNFVAEMLFEDNKDYQIYFFLSTNSSSQLPASLWSKDTFYQAELDSTLGLGIYFGFIIIMVMYNLFIYLSTRDISYLFYVLYVGSFCMIQASFSGHAYQYLWPSSPNWNEVSVPVLALVLNLFALFFSISFFSIKEDFPKLYRYILLDSVVCCALILWCLVTISALSIKATVFFTTLNMLFMVSFGVYFLAMGRKHARFFLLGWLAFLIGCILLTLMLLGWLPMNFITEHAAKIGSTLETVLLSFALSDRINIEKSERMKAQKSMEAMKLAQHKERFEEEKRILAAKAESKAKDEFLSTMSHEIRTPMNGITGILQLMKDTQVTKEQEELLSVMDSSSQTLLSVINDILDFSKIQAGKMNIEQITFDLHKLLKDLKNLYSMTTKLEVDIQFKLHIAPDVPEFIKGDPTRVRQILTNYLNNAVKFTSKGIISLNVKSENNGIIRFEVSDSGIGISPEGKDALFQRFTQVSTGTSRKYGGTGLGLSICKCLAELMDGKVGVVSELGEGSTFWFSAHLPESKQVTQQEHAESTHPSLTSARLLVVEDNPVNRFIVEKMLKKIGIGSIVFAENGEEAVSMFLTQSYQAILMDCEMPVLNGYDATRKIRVLEAENNAASTPIIALTANAGDEQVKACFESGMNAHLSKPFIMGDLKGTLCQILTAKTV